jgi:hypothetical protein
MTLVVAVSAVIYTLAGLGLALVTLLVAVKGVHLQHRDRRRVALTFEAASTPDGLKVTAKNGGKETARHVRVWLRHGTTGSDITDPGRVIGSLLEHEVWRGSITVPASERHDHLELWYAWETEDRKLRGPEKSNAPIKFIEADDPSTTSVDRPLEGKWSLAFIFDAGERTFSWGRCHAEIIDANGLEITQAFDSRHLFGYVRSDWLVEIFDEPTDQGRRVTGEVRSEIEKLAIENAPRSASGELMRLED